MKTGTIRFILRLMVGILTFLIGVVLVMLLTGFRPFERFSYSPYYRHGHCGAYRSWSPAPQPPAVGQTDGAGIVIYPSSPPLRGHATLGVTPPSSLTDAPLPPPTPPRTVR